MSSVASSDNLADEYEESGSNFVVHKDVCTEKILDVKKNSSEISYSGSLDNYSSDSDSVNSSDLDEDENNEEWNRLKNSQREIETKYDSLKNLLYKEKIREVDLKLDELKTGRFNDCEAAQKLQNQKDSRLEIASALKQLKLELAYNKYEAKNQEAMQNFENNKEILYDTIKADLEEEIVKLEEARYEVEVDSSLYFSRNLIQHGHGRDVKDNRPKPVTTSKPYIVYMLKDEEIIEDCMSIKKMIRLRALNELNNRDAEGL